VAEQPVMRFGEMALQLRLLTVDQLEEALQMQEQSRKRGLDRSVGACLHDKGYLDLVQIQDVMEKCGYATDKRRLLPDIDLKKILGRGATGAVYRGFSSTLGHDVAVKVRAPKIKGDAAEEARFKREAEVGKRLVHPNIVRVFDAGETRDFIYHVIEFVDGSPLDTLLKEKGLLPEKQVVDIGFQVASALEVAAREGIVHRDIKPANILFSNEGQAKLCDLGLAKDLKSQSNLTMQGMLLGSPYYISPEYAKSGDLDVRSDLYSLGVTLYHLACGKVPFPGKSIIEILEKVIRQPAPDPKEFNPGLSPNFRTVLLRMVEKEPYRRYQTPTDVVKVFDALKKGKRIPDPSRKGIWGTIKSWFGG